MRDSKYKGLSTMQSHCVGSGLVALDVLLLNEDRTPSGMFAGGTCYNVLAILAFFGWRSSILARLGSDAAGELVVADIKRIGMCQEGLVVDESVKTPIIIERLRTGTQGGQHRFEWRCPCCDSWLPRHSALTIRQATARAERLVQPADVFFFDRASPAVLRLAQSYRDKGALIVFEPSGVGNLTNFRKGLRLSHVLKYSHERLGDQQAALAGPEVPLEIETLGPDGLRFKDRRSCGVRSSWRSLHAFEVARVEDAVGAGDWCTAGLVFSLAGGACSKFCRWSNKQLVSALMFGQALAALNCKFRGARGLMYARTRDMIVKDAAAMIRAGVTGRDNRLQPVVPGVPSIESVCPVCGKRPKSRRNSDSGRSVT